MLNERISQSGEGTIREHNEVGKRLDNWTLATKVVARESASNLLEQEHSVLVRG